MSSLATPMITYRECQKNHAASVGGKVLDGCGEFMPSGHDGTLEALKCAACSCHRNFHRKEHHGQAEMVQPMAVVFSGNGMELFSGEQLGKKKRHRTKFTVQQKERMREFAQKIGWRIPRAMEDDEEVQSFCGEVGVKLHVFKVWMHNNKKPSQQEDQM